MTAVGFDAPTVRSILVPWVGEFLRVPERNAEIAGAEEGEQVGLGDVFVRAAGDAGERFADVGHRGMQVGR